MPYAAWVIAAVVGVGERDELADIVVSALTADDAWQLDSLHVATEPNAVLGALLDHPVILIRAAAALAFDVGLGHGLPLPEDLRLQWESAFLDADDGTVRGQLERWRLKEILKALAVSQPSLCADWFEQRLLNGDKVLYCYLAAVADGRPIALRSARTEYSAVSR